MTSHLDGLKKYANFLENDENFSSSSVEMLEEGFTEEGKELGKISESDYKNFSQEEFEEMLKIVLLVLKRRDNAYFKLINSWNEGKVSPNSGEKSLLKKYKDKTDDSYDYSIQFVGLTFLPSSREFNEITEKLKENKQRAIEKIKILDKLLSQQEKSSHSNQDNQQFQRNQIETETLRKELSKKDDLILELSMRKNNQTQQLSDSEKEALEQNIENLKKEKSQLLSQIGEKESNYKPTAGNNPTTKQFNWLYVVIPGGALLVIAGLTIAYLLGKKTSQKE